MIPFVFNKHDVFPNVVFSPSMFVSMVLCLWNAFMPGQTLQAVTQPQECLW